MSDLRRQKGGEKKERSDLENTISNKIETSSLIARSNLPIVRTKCAVWKKADKRLLTFTSMKRCSKKASNWDRKVDRREKVWHIILLRMTLDSSADKLIRWLTSCVTQLSSSLIGSDSLTKPTFISMKYLIKTRAAFAHNLWQIIIIKLRSVLSNTRISVCSAESSWSSWRNTWNCFCLAGSLNIVPGFLANEVISNPNWQSLLAELR